MSPNMAASLLCRRTASRISFSSFNSCLSSIVINQIAKYNPIPLKLNLNDPYIPDKKSDKTPEWQKTEKYERKLFARYGNASGVDPVKLWPSAARLEELAAEEKEWYPPLEVKLENIAAREREKRQKQRQREKVIAECMAQMPKMIKDWKKQKLEAKQQKLEEKQNRERIIAIVKQRVGIDVDHRSYKFKEVMEEVQKEERKKKKLLKKQNKEEMQSMVPPAAKSEL
ncbi:hypothetical protein DNTS_017911 [Danionella cerebrum]|uniref:Large ribosomal subunit protein mL64 n=1 Tax=Danionella cerebrum TaxID=2873325 RepID=A0A553MSA5_9TELE|nr:hypothetical protein DNTS_017911 [Danionella translucida]